MKEKNKIFRKYLRCKDRSKKSDIYASYKAVKNDLNNSLNFAKKSAKSLERHQRNHQHQK